MLSSYATGLSPNNAGVCSPASHVRFEPTADGLAARLGDFIIDVFPQDQPAGYPTLCKGHFATEQGKGYLFEEPTSLNALALLPRLAEIGVTALKIEGRQRGKAYVAAVVAAFRRAVDAVARGEPIPPLALDGVAEGHRGTTGAYQRGWR
jgi:putative protease